MAEFVTEWIRQDPLFNTVYDDIDPSIAVDNSGNAYVCYYIDTLVSGQTTYGSQDIRVFKLDSNGTWKWTIQKPSFNQYGRNSSPSIVVNSSGESYIAYNSATPNTDPYSTPYNIIVFKLDTNGATLWTITLAYSTDNEFGPSATLDSSGNLLVAYWTRSRPSPVWNPGLSDPGTWELRFRGQPFTGVTLYSGQDYYQTFKTDTGGYLKNACPSVYYGEHWIYLHLGEGITGPVLGSKYVFLPLSNVDHCRVDVTTPYKMEPNQYFTIHVHCMSGASGSHAAVWATTVFYDGYPDPSFPVGGSDNSYAFYIMTTVTSNISDDVVVSKITPAGAISWNRRLNIPPCTSADIARNDQSPSITVDSSGNSYVAYIRDYNNYLNNSGGDWLAVQNEITYSSQLYNQYQVLSGGYCWQSFTATSTRYVKSCGVYVLSKTGTSKVSLRIGEGLAGQIIDTQPLTGTFPGWLYANMGPTTFRMTPGQKYTIQVQCTSGFIVLAYNTGTPSPYPGGSSNLGVNTEFLFSILTTQYNGPATNIIVTKINSGGTIQWERIDSTFSTTYYDQAPSIITDGTNVYVAYMTDGALFEGNKVGYQDIIVFKLLCSNGDLQWIKQNETFNTTAVNSLPSINISVTGNLYIAYQTTGTNYGQTLTGTTDITIFKMNSNGETIWVYQQPLMNTFNSNMNPSIRITTSDYIYLAYQTNGVVSGQINTGGYDIVVLKMKPPVATLTLETFTCQITPELVQAGTLVTYTYSVHNLGEVSLDYVVLLDVAHAINIYIGTLVAGASWSGTGYTYALTSGDISAGQIISTVQVIGQYLTETVIVEKTLTTIINTSSYIIQWVQQSAIFNTYYGEYEPSIAVGQNKNVYLTYYTGGKTSGQTRSGNYDIVILKINNLGNVQWLRQLSTFNSTGENLYPVIDVDAAGNSYVAYSYYYVAPGTTYTTPTEEIDCTSGSSFVRIWEGSILWQTFTTPSSRDPGQGNKVSGRYLTQYQIYLQGGETSWGILTLRQGEGPLGPQLNSFQFSGYGGWISSSSLLIPLIAGGKYTIVIQVGNQYYDWYITDKLYIEGSSITTNSNFAFKISTVRPQTDPNMIKVVKFDTNGNQMWAPPKQFSYQNTMTNDSRPSIAVDSSGNSYFTYWADNTALPISWIESIHIGFYSPIHLWKKIEASGQTEWQSFVCTSNIYLKSFGAWLINNDPLHSYWGKYVLALYDGEGITGTQLIAQSGSLSVDPIVEPNPPIGKYYYYTPPAVVPIKMIAGNKYTISVTFIASTPPPVTQRILWAYETNNPYVGGRSSIDPVGDEEYDFLFDVISQMSSGTSADLVVRKLDTSGAELWVQTTTLPSTVLSDTNPSIDIDAAGNSYVAYFTNGIASGQSASGGYDIVVFKLNNLGQTLWVIQPPVFNTYTVEQYPSVAVDSSGNIYLTCTTYGTASGQTNDGGTDILVCKLNTNGSILWVTQQPTFNTVQNDLYPSITVDLQGSSYVAYSALGTASGQTRLGETDIVVLKFNTDGVFERCAQHPLFNTIGSDDYPSIAVDIDGDSYVTYQTDRAIPEHNNTGSSDIVVFKLTMNPVLILIEAYQGTAPLGMLVVGTPITYYYKVKNIGKVDLSDVTLQDNVVFVSNVTPGTWYIGSMSVGNEQEVTYNYALRQIDINKGQIPSTVIATGEYLSWTASTTADEIVTIDQYISINLDVYSGVINGSGMILAGNTITYTYIINNTGNVTLSNVVIIDDNGINISVGELEHGTPQTITAQYIIKQSDIDNGIITSNAKVSAYFLSNYVESPLMTETIVIVQYLNLSLTVSALPFEYYSVGTFINYYYVVRNTGNVTLTPPLTIEDDRLTVIYTSPSSLEPGQEINGNAVYNPVTQNDINNGSLTNNVTAKGMFDVYLIQIDKIFTINAIQNKQLSIVKTVTDPVDFDTVGTQINYSYVVTNSGNVTLNNPFSIIDDRATVNVVTPLTLNPGEQFTGSGIYYTTQNDLDFGSITNLATAQGFFNLDLIISFTSSAKIDAIQNIGINLTKTATPLTYDSLDDHITYTYTVLNTGNVSIEGPFVITDDRLTVNNASFPSILPPGHTFTTTVIYNITQNDLNNGLIKNNAFVRGSLNNEPVDSSIVAVTVTANQLPLLTIKKVANPTTYNTVGTIINYTYTVTNKGNVKLVGPFTVSDDKLTVVQTQMTILEPEQLFICNASHEITQNDINVGSIVNKAYAQGYNGIQLVTSSEVQVTVNAIQHIGLTLQKTSNKTTYSTVGETVVYNYIIQNNDEPVPSNVTLTGPFSITDGTEIITLEAISTLLPSESLTGQATHIITQNDIDNGWIGDPATAYGYFGLTKVQSNTITLKVTAVQNPSIILEKYQGIIPGTSHVVVGTVATYTYEVRNNGNVTLNDVQIADTNGISITIGTMIPNEMKSLTGQYVVTQTDINQGGIVSQATVTGVFMKLDSTCVLSTKSNVSHYQRQRKKKGMKEDISIRSIVDVSDQKDATITIIQYPSIQLVKQANSVGTHVGDLIQYEMTISNPGNVTLRDIVLIDPVLALVETVDSLEPLAQYVKTKDYIITQQDMNNNVVTNVAQVSGRGPDDQLVYVKAQISTVPCLLGHMMITLMDGSLRPISEIQRGDLVKPGHRVARLCTTMIDTRSLIDIMIFKPSSLCPGGPHQSLMITCDHPIIYNQARHPAKCFMNYKGVSKIRMKDLKILYDLQFDHEGSYFANGVEVQSCSPRSAINPLPKDLYYDQSLYVDDVVWDSFDQSLNLDLEPLPPK